MALNIKLDFNDCHPVRTVSPNSIRHRNLRKKQKETNVVYAIRLDKELTLKNVIQTQEQADMFMAMLKHLNSK